MKNQVFNMNRFFRYSSFNLSMNSRTYWMQLLSMVFVILSMLMFTMLTADDFDLKDWRNVFLIAGIVSVLLFVAGAFPYLKKKETQIQFYMQPASVFEKFIFEFLLRFVGFMVIFPVLFWLIGELSYVLVSAIQSMRGQDMQGFYRVSVLFDSFFVEDGELKTITFFFNALAVVMAFIFSGTCTFMKFALAKTAAFVIALGALIFYHFYYMTQVLSLRIANENEPNIHEDMPWLGALFVMLILAFGYFKLKEKEV